MDFILRACGLRRDGDAPPPPPRRLPPSEPVARRLRFRRQVRSPANPLLDLPVDVLEHCARLGELRTFHGLVVVLGHSRRPTAVALKRIVRDDRLSPSPLFRDAREVKMTYTYTPPYSNTTGEREEYCIGDSKLKTSPLHRCLVALTEAAWAGDYEVYDDDDEEIPDGILAARRAAAMQQVGATAVYHGVASIEGTNEDVGGYETVALLSVARREARCLPGAVEPPRVLFAVCTAQRKAADHERRDAAAQKNIASPVVHLHKDGNILPARGLEPLFFDGPAREGIYYSICARDGGMSR